MRLIDADKIPYVQDVTYMKDYDYAYRYAIEAEPTVDAIPVEFIKKRIDHLQDIADYALDSNGGYIESANSSLYELKLLLSRWKAEQSAKDK